MTNGTKILIAILVILAITIGVIGALNTNESEPEENKDKSQITEMLEYINETQKDETENKIEENNVIENKIESEETTANKKETIGKEEQESNEENTQLNDKEKAIQMAKDEWAISVNSYDFQATLKKEGIYEVTVISNDSNRTTVAIYTVDVKAGTVSE